VLGRRGEQAGPLRAACARGKRRPAAWEACGLKEGLGRLWREEREEGEVFLFLFKFFSNSFFKLSNFNQTENHAFES
jgi:hypothetical protein